MAEFKSYHFLLLKDLLLVDSARISKTASCHAVKLMFLSLRNAQIPVKKLCGQVELDRPFYWRPIKQLENFFWMQFFDSTSTQALSQLFNFISL